MATASWNWVIVRRAPWSKPKLSFIKGDMTRTPDFREAKLFKSRRLALGVRDAFGLRYEHTVKKIPNWMVE